MRIQVSTVMCSVGYCWVSLRSTQPTDRAIALRALAKPIVLALLGSAIKLFGLLPNS